MQSIQVKDYMKRHPVTFRADDTIFDAIEKLLSSNLTGGPVVDEHKRLIGFISEQDCIAKGLEASYHCERVALVEEFMRRDVLTVKPNDGIIEVAQQMIQAKPKLYPVVDDAGHLVGIIHRRDVLRCIEAQMRSCFKTAV